MGFYYTDCFPGEISKFQLVKRSWAHKTVLSPGLRLHRDQAARLLPALKLSPCSKRGTSKTEIRGQRERSSGM